MRIGRVPPAASLESNILGLGADWTSAPAASLESSVWHTITLFAYHARVPATDI